MRPLRRAATSALFSRAFATKSRPHPLDEVRVAFRTPITQLKEEARPDVQKVVDIASRAIRKLQERTLPIVSLDHEVLTQGTQKQNLLAKMPKDFRKERLSAVLEADIFVEVVVASSLSLSGALERGYAKAFRDIMHVLTPGERVMLNEKFPARVFQGFCGNIVVMHNGKKEFGGPLTTTLYKQDPDTKYIYIHYEGEVIADLEKLQKDFPGIMIVPYDALKIEEALVSLFEDFVQKKQAILEESDIAETVAGLAPSHSGTYQLQEKRPDNAQALSPHLRDAR